MTLYYSGDCICVGWEYDTYGGEHKCVQGFGEKPWAKEKTSKA
jgi:hypothetical protein